MSVQNGFSHFPPLGTLQQAVWLQLTALDCRIHKPGKSFQRPGATTHLKNALHHAFSARRLPLHSSSSRRAETQNHPGNHPEKTTNSTRQGGGNLVATRRVCDNFVTRGTKCRLADGMSGSDRRISSLQVQEPSVFRAFGKDTRQAP